MELEVYKKSEFYEDYIDSKKEYYERSNADACFAERLAEKDKEIAELKAKLEDVNELIKTARQMLEDAKATHYAESVDAGMRERRLKRALYKACANWAHEAKYVYEDEFSLWEDMERKCLARAKQYK